ncbi:FAD-binding domain-containing protein [Mycena venus]|uniref:FAD-binding domain-containing protein n=1 Tax=Mycena venus TaxID=2733690 RepID=A0A8H6YW24_9AGAR|nr:FAD-binding domain-containing protein [Mycena venus]
MYPVWETCFTTDQGCVLNYQDPTDPTPWTTQKCEIGSLSSAYLTVEGAEDVQHAFAFAKSTGTLLSIKNTGHDFFGRSVLKNSLALWTHNLNSVRTHSSVEGGQGDVNYTAITLGAGAQWYDVYHITSLLWEGIIPPLGAGYSVLTPTLGLGVDRALQFKIVTPDGICRTANEYQNTDLFWALRGGGGGTFGVILESTILATPQLTPQGFDIVNRTEETARNFLKLIIDNGVEWSEAGWGGHMYPNNSVSVNPLLTPEEALETMKNAFDYTLALNGSVVIEEMPSFFAFFEKYVTAADVVVGVNPVLGTRLIPKSIFFNETAKAQLLNAFAAMLPFATALLAYFRLGERLCGRFMTFPFPKEKENLSLPYRLSSRRRSRGMPTDAEKQEVFSLVDSITQSLRDVAPDSGVGQTEVFIYEPDFETAFWGNNYSRLLALKHKYDPNGLLDCWRCVEWQGAQDERYSCYPDSS